MASGQHTARFCYTNHVTASGVTISSSSEETSLPDDNVANPLRTKVWRATGDSDEYLQFDLGSAKTVQVFALFNHNFSAGATVTLMGNTTSSFATPAYSTTAATLSTQFGNVVFVLPAGTSYRYWRIRIQDASNTDGYVEAGYAYLGTYTDHDHRSQFRYQVIDPSIRVDSYDGQKSVFTRTKFRVVDFMLGDTQTLGDVQDIVDSIGYNRDFVLMLDPDENAFDNVSDGLSRFTMYGSLLDMAGEHRIRGVFNFGVRFEEAT